MRIPYTHGIRRNLRALFEQFANRIGIRSEDPFMFLAKRKSNFAFDGLVQRMEEKRKAGKRWDQAEIDLLLNKANSADAEAKSHMIYLRSNWKSPIAQWIWALKWRPTKIHLSSHRSNAIAAALPIREGEHVDDSCHLTVDGEDILEWLCESCQSTVMVSMTSTINNANFSGHTSIVIEFTDHRDAVAFKLCFFELYNRGFGKKS